VPSPGSGRRRNRLATIRTGRRRAWGTYVWVETVDAAAASARDAGGGVVVESFESLDGGRMAILSDPAGAVFGV
jgi:predicted enzyme related to lactoylglutathione lyase